MPLSLPPIQALEENRNQRFTLRNADPNSGSDPDLVVTALELLHEGRRKEVYRGTLSEPIEDAPYVACKVAYGQNAMRKLGHEAALYQGRLKPLQDAWVPICYGYFVGDTDEGLTGCLILDYCGEPVNTRFSCLGYDFRVQVISAFVEIHNAGVCHNDVSERNVLNCDGIPLVIDFEDATEEECRRKVDVVVNTIEPHPGKFGCKELFELTVDLGLWKPALVLYGGEYQSTRLLDDPHKLAATAPEEWSEGRAFDEACKVIAEHYKIYYPSRYKKWLAERKADEGGGASEIAAVGHPSVETGEKSMSSEGNR